MKKIKDTIQKYIAGDWGKSDFSSETPQKIHCIRGADINSINEHRYNSIPNRYVKTISSKNKRLYVGDIVIEKSGGSPTQSTGRTAYISQNSIKNDIPILCSNFCQGIRVNNAWNSKYVFYWLQHVYNKGMFFNFESKTSGIKNLMLDSAFADIPIPHPDLSEQLRIAGILGSLDEKIAINRRKIAELEALAKLIYDHWFVQFDFPDANGKPYKSSGGKMVWNETLKREIPVGWDVDNIYRIADYFNGLACQKYRPSSKQVALPVIKIKEMHDGITDETEFVSSDIPEHYKISDGSMLFSWSATLETMIWTGGDAGLNQHIFKVVPHNGFPMSFVFLQVSAYIGNFVKMADARKTTMGHITTDHMKQSRILIPSQALLNAFSSVGQPIFNEIIKNRKEIAELTRVRDWLLPMLMNGQACILE